MAIIHDYEGIAKRLRELQSATPKGAIEITVLEKWRDMAKETARAYVQDRKNSIAGKRIIPRRPQPTD